MKFSLAISKTMPILLVFAACWAGLEDLTGNREHASSSQPLQVAT